MPAKLPKAPDERGLEARAGKRFGIFARTEAVAARFGRGAIGHRLETGAWVERMPGVYALRAFPRSWEQDLWAVLLWGGEGAVASHRSAARLWGLRTFASSKEIDVTLPHFLKPPPNPEIDLRLFQNQKLGPWDVTTKGGWRLTRPERTIFDLAGLVARDEVPRTYLDQTLDDALRDKRVSEVRLKKDLTRLAQPGRVGSGEFRALLERHTGTLLTGASRGERKLFKLLAGAGLLPSERELSFPERKSRKEQHRSDYAFPAERLLLEYDPPRIHDTKYKRDADRQRRNDLTARGWRILSITPADLEHPEQVVTMVREALAQRRGRGVLVD